jgi:hypothetical protein
MITTGLHSSAVRASGRAAATGHAERAVRLYRQRIGRCRTENQVNRVHIAIENYMTPAEARYFRVALDGDPAESPSRLWITRLTGAMPTNIVRPVEFERRGLLKGVTHYTADISSTDQKTLIIGFTGIAHRLMMPTPWVLDCLNPALYDVVLLRDFSRVAYASGIRGLGADFVMALSNLPMHVDPRGYRNTIAFGTSLGGIPAILAAILLNLDKAIAIGPQEFGRIAALLRRHGLSDEPYASLLASRPQPFPEVVLVCGAEHGDDVAAAASLQQRVPARVVRVRNCAAHVVLGWHHGQGTLPAFLAKILGQSLEDRPRVPTTLAASWVVSSTPGWSLRSNGGGVRNDPTPDPAPKP